MTRRAPSDRMRGRNRGAGPRRVGSRLRSLPFDSSGAALALAALIIAAVLGMLALAIDLGMLYETRGQAQRTADSAALAGAAALVDYGNSADVIDQVHQYAMAYVNTNPVRGVVASVEPGDIVVDLAAWRVTVSVYRTAGRGNAVPTVFGRIIGIDTANVSTIATAEAAPAAGVPCLLPLAMPDRWEDMASPPDGTFDPAAGDFYIAPSDSGPGTGYTDAHIGTEIVIKPFKSAPQVNNSWYFPWRPPGLSGGSVYRDSITGCVDPTLITGFGDVVDTEPGAMVGPTKQGFTDLIAMDPYAYWDEFDACVRRPDVEGCVGSPRIRPMPLFNPTEPPDPGAKPFTFTNFISVFVKELRGNEVLAVLMGVAGVAPGSGGSGTNGPAVRYVRLIQ